MNIELYGKGGNMLDTKIRDLLERMGRCPVSFDPTVDQNYGTVQPGKVAFVPVILWEELRGFLAGLVRR
jgi:hypothetical protein